MAQYEKNKSPFVSSKNVVCEKCRIKGHLTDKCRSKPNEKYIDQKDYEKKCLTIATYMGKIYKGIEKGDKMNESENFALNVKNKILRC